MTWICASCACENPDANGQCMICMVARDPGANTAMDHGSAKAYEGAAAGGQGIVVGAEPEVGLLFAENTDLDIATLAAAVAAEDAEPAPDAAAPDAAADRVAPAVAAAAGDAASTAPEEAAGAHAPAVEEAEDEGLAELSLADVAVDPPPVAAVAPLEELSIDAIVSLPAADPQAAASAKARTAAGGGFFGPQAEAPAMPIFDMQLDVPAAKPRRASRQDMTSMLQEFSVMFRVDDRARKRKAWAARIAVLGLLSVGGIVGARWWSLRPTDSVVPTAELVADVRPPHGTATEYLLIDRRIRPPTSERFRVSELSARLAGVCAMAGLRHRHDQANPAADQPPVPAAAPAPEAAAATAPTPAPAAAVAPKAAEPAPKAAPVAARAPNAAEPAAPKPAPAIAPAKPAPAKPAPAKPTPAAAAAPAAAATQVDAEAPDATDAGATP